MDAVDRVFEQGSQRSKASCHVGVPGGKALQQHLGRHFLMVAGRLMTA